MKKFLLIIKGQSAHFNKIPEAEKYPIYQKYGAYSQKLKAENKFIVGDALNEKGLQIVAEVGIPQVKTTFSDTDMVATGFYIFLAENMNEATEISKNCPALTHGDFVELYQLSEMA